MQIIAKKMMRLWGNKYFSRGIKIVKTILEAWKWNLQILFGSDWNFQGFTQVGIKLADFSWNTSEQSWFADFTSFWIIFYEWYILKPTKLYSAENLYWEFHFKSVFIELSSVISSNKSLISNHLLSLFTVRTFHLPRRPYFAIIRCIRGQTPQSLISLCPSESEKPI